MTNDISKTSCEQLDQATTALRRLFFCPNPVDPNEVRFLIFRRGAEADTTVFGGHPTQQNPTLIKAAVMYHPELVDVLLENTVRLESDEPSVLNCARHKQKQEQGEGVYNGPYSHIVQVVDAKIAEARTKKYMLSQVVANNKKVYSRE